MPDDSAARAIEKLAALFLFVVWSAGTLAMTVESIETVTPPFWMPFTAIVFLLIGKLWDLEVAKFLPGGN